MSFDCACQNLGPKTPTVPFPQGRGSCQGNHGHCHAGPSLVVHASNVLVKGVRCLFQDGRKEKGEGSLSWKPRCLYNRIKIRLEEEEEGSGVKANKENQSGQWKWAQFS